ncbi:hypothetical protein O1M63_18060 [Streptomyces mirabilis]|nr:hypothetical protein [Streptomyces mirabilis]
MGLPLLRTFQTGVGVYGRRTRTGAAHTAGERDEEWEKALSVLEALCERGQAAGQ